MAQDIQSFFEGLPSDVIQALGQMSFELPHTRANNDVAELLNKTVLEGGKRLRPLLTLLAAKTLNIELHPIQILARSIEQVHAASLAHDDVIDLATLRRGAPSINVEGSNKKAILAGDFLLAQVIAGLSELDRPDLLKEMAEVIQDLALGEWLQWDIVLDRRPTQDLLEEIAAKKTATVMSWCFVAPWLYDRQNDDVLTCGRKLGYHLGIAFQLMDDTLDDLQSSQKDEQLDVNNDQVNSVAYEWMRAHPECLESFAKGAALLDLLSGVDLSSAREVVRLRAVDHLNHCRSLLKDLGKMTSINAQGQDALETVFDFLEHRKF